MSCYAERLFPRIRSKQERVRRKEAKFGIANTLDTCPKRSVRDRVGILINRIKKKLRAEEVSERKLLCKLPDFL